MIEAIRLSLGYDAMGNSPRLLTADDHYVIESGGVRRVSGEALCPRCNEAYRLHPPVQGALWVTRGCDGLVKL